MTVRMLKHKILANDSTSRYKDSKRTQDVSHAPNSIKE